MFGAAPTWSVTHEQPIHARWVLLAHAELRSFHDVRQVFPVVGPVLSKVDHRLFGLWMTKHGRLVYLFVVVVVVGGNAGSRECVGE